VAVRKSWEEGDPSIYGRFDLAYGGEVTVPKMLEYNADTPTSCLETGVAQWQWLEEVRQEHGADQFNSLHDKLVRRWGKIPLGNPIHFASLRGNEEDWVCVHYLMDTAQQAGHEVKHVYIEDIGLRGSTFVDLENAPIHTLFKLYPWEWMMREQFADAILASKTQFIEPLWKCVLSNKALLPVLWELYPDHPNLVPAYFDQHGMDSYARKPIFSREGANVELFRHNIQVASDVGPYGAEGFIYQQLIEMPQFEKRYPVIGSWVIGDEAAGMCIREDANRITTNMSNFVPHYFT
jgi:glutathionylspermidine synthase